MVAVIWTVLLRANTLAYFSLFVLMAHQMRTRCWEMVLIRDFFRVYLTVWQAVETFEVFYRLGWWLLWLSALNAKVKVMFGYLAVFHKWSDYVLKATRRTCQLESRTLLELSSNVLKLGKHFGPRFGTALLRRWRMTFLIKSTCGKINGCQSFVFHPALFSQWLIAFIILMIVCFYSVITLLLIVLLDGS